MEKSSSLIGTLTTVCILVLFGTMQIGVGWYLYKQLHADIRSECVPQSKFHDEFLRQLKSPESQTEIGNIFKHHRTRDFRQRRDIFDDEDAQRQLCSIVEHDCKFPPPLPPLPGGFDYNCPRMKGEKGEKGSPPISPFIRSPTSI